MFIDFLRETGWCYVIFLTFCPIFTFLDPTVVFSPVLVRDTSLKLSLSNSFYSESFIMESLLLYR